MQWNTISSEADLQSAIKQSHNQTIVLFKHSTSCSISGLAKLRLEDNIDNVKDKVKFYYLDLLAHRSISNLIAENLAVHHESPQMIVLQNGAAIHDSSHFDISIDELNEVIEYQKR